MRNFRMLWALATNRPAPGEELIQRELRAVGSTLSVLDALVALKKDMI